MNEATIYDNWQGSRLFDARAASKLPGVKVGDYVLTGQGLQVVRANGRTDKQFQHLMSLEKCATDDRFRGIMPGFYTGEMHEQAILDATPANPHDAGSPGHSPDLPHTEGEIDETHDAMLAGTGRF